MCDYEFIILVRKMDDEDASQADDLAIFTSLCMFAGYLFYEKSVSVLKNKVI